MPGVGSIRVFRSEGCPMLAEPRFTLGEALDEAWAEARTHSKTSELVWS
jgi:hypothetical protein